jgi:hypothetical protein
VVVGHVGPPTGRTGGPAGYLLQLKSAGEADAHPRHDVRFPLAAGPRRPSPSPQQTPANLLHRLRRKLFGPKFYRPPFSELTRTGGVVDHMMQRITADVCADARPSLESALAHADVVFTHDPFSAEPALTARRGGQQVWMMCHAVTPMALYAAWSWALPEADWRDLLAYPDVRSWIEWELDIWSRVDRVILPCAEAADTFRPIDPRFADILDRAEYVLSGASAPPRASGGADPTTRGADLIGPRKPGERIGLYLGSPEP